MSDIMYPVSFGKLMNHIMTEYTLHNRIYNVKKIHRTEHDKALTLFGKKLENPVGPAAGPNTQLAQNIVASYVGGARCIDLKTVQIMYGEELGIPRPCINSVDEAYNVEWSSEYSPAQAADEYIKAWFAIKLIAKEYNLGDPNGFLFIMSVGYNLAGIKSESVDTFIETMRHGSKAPIWNECKQWALDNVDKFQHVDVAFINSISDEMSDAITLSTMHGCPADEIEAICTYLMKEKGLNLYLKCNPTLLGPKKVRDLLDNAGFDYIKFDDHQFDVDLKFDAAVPMLERLIAIGEEKQVVFGVKLTNTFPVAIHNAELPGKEMYMSGKSLLPLTVGVAELLSSHFGERLPISYSGGAVKQNIKSIFECGIWPVTVCTILLQGEGYDTFKGLADEVESTDYEAALKVNKDRIAKLVADIADNKLFKKSEAMKKKYADRPNFPDARSNDYRCRVVCGACVRVCPNRTNEILHLGEQKLIIHIDESCNECGNCACHCVEPCQPYKDRLTYFHNSEAIKDSTNDGFYVDGNNCGYRFKGAEGVCAIDALPEELKGVVQAFIKEHAYYIA
ncbi:selenate reductase [Veillonella agrestimuris]|uniref:selenate reductase n=1 Tax=Veillonella agrestimuris TaxID=2941340 RepID=UPI0020421B7D|nr:selenate reductase [Veillonella agrestimuris]